MSGLLGSQPADRVIHHRQRTRESKSSRMQLNFTSMIDVVFLLLIYFISTVSFAVGEGVLTAKLPQGTGEPNPIDPPPRPLNILIANSGRTGFHIEVEGLREAPSSFTGLASLLKRLQYDPAKGRSGAYKPDNPVIIKPTGAVRWQHIVNAFNAAIAAQYTRVNFAQAKAGDG